MTRYLWIATEIAALAALATVIAPPAEAADMPKSGHGAFDAYITARPVDTLDLGAGNAKIYQLDGFDQFVGKGGPFALTTFHCIGEDIKLGEKYDSLGSCIKTDKEGDHIFYTWDDNGWKFIGGTGKFKGITAKGIAKPTYFHDSGDRGWELVVHHEGDWEIK